MATEAELKLLLTAKDDASKTLGGFKKTLTDVSKIAGGFVLAKGLLGAPKLMGGLAKEAGALDLQMKKANQVFGDQEDLVEKWARANATAMGLTKREATAAAASFADLLIPMGFTRQEAASLSTNVVGLSGALSEWSGGQYSATQVSDILARALLGERDSLKGLGISISEADVQQRILEKGQQNLTGAAREQAEAVATQELIMEKSTDAQAAFAEGSGSLARKQAELSAKLKDVKEDILVALLPAMTAVATWIVDTGIPKLEDFAQKIGPDLKAAWEDDLKPALSAIKDTLQNEFWPAFKTGLDTVMPLVEGLFNFIIDHKEAMMGAIIAIGVAIFLALGPVSQAVIALAGIITLVGLVKTHWEELKELLEEGIKVGPIKLSSKANDTKPFGILPSNKDIEDFIGGLLGFDRGGVVPGPTGAPRLAMVHGGETVLPTHRGGGGASLHVTIMGDVYGEEDFARKMQQAIQGGHITDVLRQAVAG